MPRLPVGLGLALCAAGLAALLALGLVRESSRAPGGDPRPPEHVTPGARAAPTLSDVTAAPVLAEDVDPDVLRLARGPRPGSLAGTDADGGLSVDESGHFHPDPDALALFDYFLSASGEEPAVVIRQRIVDEIQARLEAPAEGEALALLDGYLLYREDVRELAEGGAVPHDLERRLQWLRELRRTHFGAASEILFGTEEEAVRVDLERRRIWSDASLDADAKDDRLAALEERLPDDVREARRRARGPARVRGEVRRLRAEGADERELFAVREEAFGTSAAERLAVLDEQRAAWSTRVDAYRIERAALLAQLGLDPEATGPERSLMEADRARLEALRRSHFQDLELLRVRVLDQAL